MRSLVIIVGMGEVGRPLHTVLSKTYECVGVDVERVNIDAACSVLHICYPYQIKGFVRTTVSYIETFRPKLTIINSTVPPGTTRAVYEASKAQIAYSPIRGKHVRMEQELLRYRKFVAGIDPASTIEARQHFEAAGLATDEFRSPEIGELSKLLETTWLGVLIGWAQEIQRFAATYDASYREVNAFVEEIDFLPSHIFPGVIGGHCVMPNIELLREVFDSQFLNAVVVSNELREQSEPNVDRERICRELV